MWWSCPEISQFWFEVVQVINELTHIRLLMEIRVLLLLDFDYAGLTFRKNSLAHMLTVASLLIAKYWKAREKTSGLGS